MRRLPFSAGPREFIYATFLERTFCCACLSSKYLADARRMSAQAPVQAVVCYPDKEHGERPVLIPQGEQQYI
ncbi:uncharacterized protein BDV17DRAFT_269829 [Aspergillus undulatus]|uniref:uncharacterized protein n=1 Tax=Aspergillus undulatus TaxID=1810928 RepID=UPI003CCD66DB